MSQIKKYFEVGDEVLLREGQRVVMTIKEIAEMDGVIKYICRWLDDSGTIYNIAFNRSEIIHRDEA